ncbi:MAG: neutral/alkaline non-lysosomal ceramidase N-terminal domain-containing protein, partial [Limisphaerales bacterium]
MRAISCLFLLLSAGEGFSAWLTNAGIARIDITPSYSVPLSGYGNRTRMSDGVEQRIWAKALAFNPGTDDVAVLLTVDNCGVPFHVRREVLRRLKKIKPERFAILSSHTHSAPMLKGVLENIYSRDLTKEERTAMNRYTDDLTVSLVKVVQDAILNPIPARFSYGIGHSTMAENRRYGSGPTDDDVPVLQVEGEDGKILAVLANYACHCTAISGKLTKVCGDWGGYTQEFIEKQFPGSMA